MHPDPQSQDPLDWAADHGAADDVVRQMNLRVAARRRRRDRRRWLAAGLAAVSAIVITFYHVRSTAPAKSHPVIAVTVPSSAILSRPEQQTLPDGSIVELKPGAKITLAFTDGLRRVELVAGEAHFQVAKNAHRPFVVTARATEFRAVGTAFTVQLGQAEVELVVTEGRVAVDRPATATEPGPVHTLALVDAGNRLAVPAEPSAVPLVAQVEPIAAEQLSERLAWRVPRLELNRTPLGDALPLFNQHSGTRLVLGDSDLARVRLSGVLRADNVDTLLALLEESHGVRIERRPGEIVLRRAR